MNEVTVFENEQFGKVRTIDIDGEPWFVGKDVATALGYSNTADAIKKHTYDEDRLTDIAIRDESLSDSVEQTYGMTVINESGVYSMIFGSRLETAKRFKHWVTSEVLPSIRKTGAYALPADNNRVESFEMALLAVKATADLINAGEAGRLMMMEKLCTSEGVNTAFIPEYGSNGNHKQMSLTDLLKKNNCSIKAGAFNKLLIAEGYLEEQERQSSKRDDEGNPIMKKFKVLTEKGTRYGVNMVSRHNQRETQPLYFDDTFMELYNTVIGD